MWTAGTIQPEKPKEVLATEAAARAHKDLVQIRRGLVQIAQDLVQVPVAGLVSETVSLIESIDKTIEHARQAAGDALLMSYAKREAEQEEEEE